MGKTDDESLSGNIREPSIHNTRNPEMTDTTVVTTFNAKSSKDEEESVAPDSNGFQKFAIEFDDDNHIYSPGETVRGRETGVIKIIGPNVDLTLQWSGEAKSQLAISQHVFTEKQTYIFGSQDLIYSKITKLKAGLHEFIFAINLPADVPSSFVCEQPQGSVVYCVTAIAKKTRLFFDEKVEKEFCVRGTHDLNEHPECLLAEEATQDARLCCYCWVGKPPIGYIVKLEQTGFLAGETINFVAELFNRSRRAANVQLTFFVLERKVFWAQGKSAQAKDRILAEIPGPKLDALNKEIVQSFEYELPALWREDLEPTENWVHPTGLGGCRLINLDYIFKVEMKLPCNDEKSSEIRIRIGTKPIRKSHKQKPKVLDNKTIKKGKIQEKAKKEMENEAKPTKEMKDDVSANSFNY